jgi:hypothetical protein
MQQSRGASLQANEVRTGGDLYTGATVATKVSTFSTDSSEPARSTGSRDGESISRIMGVQDIVKEVWLVITTGFERTNPPLGGAPWIGQHTTPNPPALFLRNSSRRCRLLNPDIQRLR